jgi:hypothetical protein
MTVQFSLRSSTNIMPPSPMSQARTDAPPRRPPPAVKKSSSGSAYVLLRAYERTALLSLHAEGKLVPHGPAASLGEPGLDRGPRVAGRYETSTSRFSHPITGARTVTDRVGLLRPPSRRGSPETGPPLPPYSLPHYSLLPHTSHQPVVIRLVDHLGFRRGQTIGKRRGFE